MLYYVLTAMPSILHAHNHLISREFLLYLISEGLRPTGWDEGWITDRAEQWQRRHGTCDTQLLHTLCLLASPPKPLSWGFQESMELNVNKVPSRKHDWLVGWGQGFSFPVSVFSRIQKYRVFIIKQPSFKSSFVKDRSPCVLRGQFSFSEAKDPALPGLGVGLSLCFGHFPSLTRK